MLRISKLADYAFILLAAMAVERVAPWTAVELAQESMLPVPTVAKILKMLARSGLLSAQRGATGGYRLTRKLEAMTVAEVLQAIDGPVALACCLAPHPPKKSKRSAACVSRHLCPMHKGWRKINDAFIQTMTDVSVAEMTGRTAQAENEPV